MSHTHTVLKTFVKFAVRHADFDALRHRCALWLYDCSHWARVAGVAETPRCSILWVPPSENTGPAKHCSNIQKSSLIDELTDLSLKILQTNAPHLPMTSHDFSGSTCTTRGSLSLGQHVWRPFTHPALFSHSPRVEASACRGTSTGSWQRQRHFGVQWRFGHERVRGRLGIRRSQEGSSQQLWIWSSSKGGILWRALALPCFAFAGQFLSISLNSPFFNIFFGG